MYINELIIEQFGAIQNQRIKVKPGINLLYGENESGKSTLCAFIKFVFYGFQNASERKRHSNIYTGKSSGAIIITDDSKVMYRIECTDTESSKNKFSVYTLPGNTEFNIWKTEAPTPGDFFLGINDALYTRSIYISQVGGSKLEKGSAEAISNLLISGDETSDLKFAKNTLTNARKQYKLLKGNGGLIDEAQNDLESLNFSYNEAAKQKEETEVLRYDIDLLNKKKIEASKKLSEYRDRQKNIRLAHIKTLVNGLTESNKNIENQNLALTELDKSYTFNNYLPDDSYISQIKDEQLIVDLKKKKYEDSVKEVELNNIANLPVPVGYETYIEVGPSKLSANFTKLQQNTKGAKVLFIFCSIVAILSFISSFLPFTNSLAISITLTILFALASFTVYVYIYRISNKNLKLLISSLGINLTRTFDTFSNECETYKSKTLGLENLLKAQNTCLSELNYSNNVLSNTLSLWVKKSAEDTIFEFNTYKSKRKEILDKISNYEYHKSTYDSQLNHYKKNLSEIDEAINMSEERYSKSLLDDLTDDDVRNAEIALMEIQENLYNLERELASKTGASLKSPELILNDITETQNKINKYKNTYDALMLALSTLEQAELSIRTKVSPYLSQYGGEYFNELTKGRYPYLIFDPEVNLSYRTESDGQTYDSMYLSGGSTDVAWLCLRLALHKKLSEMYKLPLIFDECFVYCDDVRLKSILELLYNISEESSIQIFLFSANTREHGILGNKANIISLS